MTQEQDLNTELQLTEREILIAQHAANLAVKKMWEEFYKEGGKTLYRKFIPALGLVAVGFMMGRGVNWTKLMEFLAK